MCVETCFTDGTHASLVIYVRIPRDMCAGKHDTRETRIPMTPETHANLIIWFSPFNTRDKTFNEVAMGSVTGCTLYSYCIFHIACELQFNHSDT